MFARFSLFPIGVLALAGCQPSSVAPVTPVSLASLPHHRQLAQLEKAASAVLLAPAPAVSELSSSASPAFGPPPGSLADLYLDFLKGARPKRSLLVLEPQNTNNPFFAGCARWMKLYGAGSTAFDSGTTWGMADDVRRARSWESLALERGRAVQLARGLDVSHVAIGSLQKGILKYQVLDVSAMPSRVVGTFSLGGTPAQIEAGLPRLTRQIAGAAGASNVAVPSRVGFSTSDLAFLGSLPFLETTRSAISPAQRAHLTTLAGTPLGAMFVGRVSNIGDPVRGRAVQTLVAIAPNNALAGAEAAMKFEGIEAPRRVAAMRALDAKFPRNLCVALGNAALRGQEEDYFAQVHYAEMGVRSAPDCAFAWYTLAEALNGQADQKRQGKYYQEMTRDQKIEVAKLYPRALVAAWKATQLEPGDAAYWTTLSDSATFAGDANWARDALARALKCDPSNEDALNWGLQVFQPKWYGDAPSYAKMARIAVENGRGESLDVDALCDGLKKTNQQSLKRPLLQILVKNEPDNEAALIEYSNALRMETGDSKSSLPFARRAVQLDPTNIGALGELADIEQHDMGQYAQAATLFRRAANLEPKNAVLWVNLALALAKGGKLDEARAMALKGRALGYTGPHPVWNLVGLSPDGSTDKPAVRVKAAT